MIKKIISLPATASLLLASVAHADINFKPEGFYLKGAVGQSVLNDLSLKSALLTANIGYKKGAFRIDGQYGHQNVYDYVTIYSDKAAPYAHNYKGNYNSLSLNGYFDFDNHTPFSPYVGVGIEGYKVSITKLKDHNIDSYKNTLGPVGIVGVRAYMNDNIAWDLSYRTTQLNEGRFSSGLKDGTASLGLVYHF